MKMKNKDMLHNAFFGGMLIEPEYEPIEFERV